MSTDIQKHSLMERPIINGEVAPAKLQAETPSFSSEDGGDSDCKPILPKKEEEAALKFSLMSRRQKFTLVSLSIMKLTSSASYSIIAPFFPKKAASVGASETETGFVFGVYALTMIITAPVFGKFLPRLGSRKMFIGGMAVGGLATIVLGLLDVFDSRAVFISLSFISRIIEALGCSACITASYVIIVNEFPTGVATASGTVELFNGLGFIIGPPLGGALYDAAGYMLPFMVLGGIMLIFTVVNYFLLPIQEKDDSKIETGSLLELLKIPAILITAMATCMGAVALSYMNPTLSLHLAPFNFSLTVVGLFFLLVAVCYAVSAPIWGWVSDRRGVHGIAKIIMTGGLLGACVAYFFVGPCPILGVPTYPWSVAVSLAVLGFSLAAILVPILRAVLETTRMHGLEDNMATYGMVSGLFYSMYSLGIFVGPTLSGALTDLYGFGWATSINSLMMFLMAIVMCAFTVHTRRKKSEAAEESSDPTQMGWVKLKGVGHIETKPIAAQQQ
ncbi:MFS-type transporter SLC18B1-like [Ptychodera flava]|uniref:MFS-type transporter SLC18B1-like n=1 Tax=Ptychodera flava TaxID=63121 RepID=UPI00396A804D